MRPIAIFRFSPTEGPAGFAAWLDARSLPWELVAVDAHARIPADATRYAGIGLMGGPMSVNDELPWVDPICALLRAAVARGVPVIGHCLGGQLLAKAMGAVVASAATPEIGWIDVATVDAATRGNWFGGRKAFTTFQWHYESFTLPPGATRVLTNAYNVEQGFVLDDRHLALQSHVEMTPALLESWLASGAGELPADDQPARQSATAMQRDSPRCIGKLRAVAESVYSRWARALVG